MEFVPHCSRCAEYVSEPSLIRRRQMALLPSRIYNATTFDVLPLRAQASRAGSHMYAMNSPQTCIRKALDLRKGVPFAGQRLF